MRVTMLGNTGLKVSALSLGCMYFGSAIDEPQSVRLLDIYLEAGGTFLDTANNYAYWVEGCQGGESESVLGRWMKVRQNRRDIFLATKVGSNMPPRVPRSLSKATIVAQCEDSLRRLQTDYIDLYYAHTDDRGTPLEETLEAFTELVQEGKVRQIGCSNMLAWRIAHARGLSRAHHWAEYCCVQQRHTYLRPKAGLTAFSNGQVPTTSELLDYAAENADNFAIVAYSTLLGGAYSRPEGRIPENYQPDEYDAADKRVRLQVLHQIAEEADATPNQVVLAWMLQGTPTMIPLIASSSVKRLQEDLAAEQLSLTADQLTRLEQASA